MYVLIVVTAVIIIVATVTIGLIFVKKRNARNAANNSRLLPPTPDTTSNLRYNESEPYLQPCKTHCYEMAEPQKLRDLDSRGRMENVRSENYYESPFDISPEDANKANSYMCMDEN